MKTFLFPTRPARWLATGACSLLCLTVPCVAAPGGNASGSGVGVASTGGTASSGGHGGGSPSGGGHAGGTSVGTGQASGFSGASGHAATGLTGARFSNLVPTSFSSRQGNGATYTNGSGGFARANSSGPGSTLRSYNNGRAGVDNAAGFTMSRSFDGSAGTGAMRVIRSAPSASNAPQVRNAWTEPNNPHVNPAARPSRYGYNNAYDEDRSALQNRVTAGQHTYPGAAGYTVRNGGTGNASGNLRGPGGDRRTRDAYNRFYFTSLFCPYLYNSFFPAYGGYFGGGYGFGDYSGYDGNALDDPSLNTPIAGNVTNTYNTPSGDQDVPSGNTNQPTAPSDEGGLPPNQPSSVGPQGPTVAPARESTETGPDTLVESVQSELSKRGYYGDKVDSMYNDATRAALKRFQGDHRLPATGRINEATLHALQLD